MRQIILGISGASGAILGHKILESLASLPDIKTHLVISRWAKTTLEHETQISLPQLLSLADFTYDNENLSAGIASGSFGADNMIIAPCSMKTLAAIRSGYSDSLMTRAADVMLKERKKLVLVAREAPLSAIHLENMLALTQMGAVIFPPAPAFYLKPQSIDEMTEQMALRIISLIGIEHPRTKKWQGLPEN